MPESGRDPGERVPESASDQVSPRPGSGTEPGEPASSHSSVWVGVGSQDSSSQWAKWVEAEDEASWCFRTRAWAQPGVPGLGAGDQKGPPSAQCDPRITLKNKPRE